MSVLGVAVDLALRRRRNPNSRAKGGLRRPLRTDWSTIHLDFRGTLLLRYDVHSCTPFRLSGPETVRGVRCRGRFTDTELVSLLNRAALMIYAPRLEPFGLAPLEANACGTPIVAVAEGGIRETVRHGENGLLVNGRDPDALGRAVVRLLEDAELARRLGSRGRELVSSEWTWQVAIDRLEACLQSAMKGEAGMR